MRFATKIDWWILAFVLSVVGLMLFSGVVLLIRHEGDDVLMGSGSILVCLGLLSIMVPTRYVIEDEILLVRSGLFCWRIPFDRILEVQRSNNPLSAPAWSLKRLNVRYLNKKGKETFVLISPRLQLDFLQALLERTPGLERNGDRLTRSGDNEKPGGVL